MKKIERYMTRGIQADVPMEIQLFLWELQTGIRKSNKEIDYLQVYDLIIEEGQQKIRHTSEEPEYEKEYVIQVEEPMIAKIYIIEDDYGDKLVETMLLAEEYWFEEIKRTTRENVEMSMLFFFCLGSM